jgi:squalene synthase HpnC
MTSHRDQHELGLTGITSVDHYENFPVASVLVPTRLRPAVVAIYRFARHADDLADEGDASPGQRLEALDELAAALHDPATGIDVMAGLHPQLRRHSLPIEPFESLLSAFRQDVITTRYADLGSVDDYCRRSADPVGELMLRLFGAWTDEACALSSSICSGLQWANFLQDLAIDWRRGRLYLPLDALTAAGLDESSLQRANDLGSAEAALRQVIGAHVNRTRAMLQSGRPLVRRVPFRLGLELRAIIAGGLRILDRLEREGNDPFRNRPTLGWRDAPALLRLCWQTSR